MNFFRDLMQRKAEDRAELQKLSGKTTGELSEIIASYPFDERTLLKFYQAYGRFPTEIESDFIFATSFGNFMQTIKPLEDGEGKL